MAKLDVIKKIIAGEKPAAEDNAVVTSYNKVAARMGAAPLDTTEVFTDKTKAEEYAKETLAEKWQNGAQPYVGQHVTVVDEQAGTADMYHIQNTAGDLRKVTESPLTGKTFDFNGKTVGEVVKELIEALGGQCENY